MKLQTTAEERALWGDEVMHFERDILKRASARGDVTDRTKRLLLDHDTLTARLVEAEHSLAEMREALGAALRDYEPCDACYASSGKSLP